MFWYKKILLAVFLFCFLSVNLMRVEAQEEKSIRVTAEVGKQVVFDASELVEKQQGDTVFRWDFGDGGSAEGEGVLHSYLKPGYYRASLSVESNGEKKQSKNIEAYVYDKLFVGIVDVAGKKELAKDYEQQVFEQGKLLWMLDVARNSSSVDGAVDQILDNKNILQKAHGLVLWGSGSFGVDVLVKASQRSDFDWSNINVLVVSDQSLGSLKKAADTAFNLVSPKSLVIGNDKLLQFVQNLNDVTVFINKLQEEGLAHELIGIRDNYRMEPASRWMIVTRLVNYTLFNGVPLSTIVLILLVPIIALLVAIARQVIGIRAFGIYVPSLITLAFLESGIRYGTIVFLVVLAVGTFARMILRRLSILYLPRMGMVLTAVAFGCLLMMAGAAYFNVSGLKILSIVPLMTMIILTEKFVSAQIRYGFSEALKLTTETFILSAVCYYLVGWQAMKTVVISYPEMVLLVIPILYFLGRWTGLRLTEYWRFRRIIK